MIKRDEEFIKIVDKKVANNEWSLFATIGDYQIYKDENNYYIFGNKIFNFKENHVIEIIYKKMLAEHIQIEINPEIYSFKFQDKIKDEFIGYAVSFLTLNSLRNFKLNNQLNLLTFYFEKKEDALVFLDLCNTIKIDLYLNSIEKTKKLIKEIDNQDIQK